MDRSLAFGQRLHAAQAPDGCLARSVATVERRPSGDSRCYQRRHQMMLGSSFCPSVQVRRNHLALPGTISSSWTLDPSRHIRILKSGPTARLRRSTPTCSGGKEHRGISPETQRWKPLKKINIISCQSLEKSSQLCHRGETRLSGLGENLDDSIKISSSSSFAGIGNWLPPDSGVASLNLKIWFRSVCSTVLALAICVPQAWGAGAVIGDLGLLDCETTQTTLDSFKGLDGVILKEKLHDLVKDHKVYRYIEVWDALKVLDEAEDDPNSVIDVYSLKKVPKSGQGKTDGWNREHLWPRSFGLIDGQPGFTDLHNLRPSDTNVNSSRGNKAFGDCSTQEVRCTVPANKEAGPDTGTNKEIWMPPAKVRGDIARAVFYMAVRYGSEQPVGVKELKLSNTPDVGNEVMGLLSDLLRWNELDPPTESERQRNNKVCALYQKNRNPFVDHPEFAKVIWGDGSAPLPDTPDTPDIPDTPTPPRGDIIGWINELHYDNDGADQDEFVEVIVAQDVDPSTLKVLLYNNNGKEYKSLSLANSNTFTKVDDIGDGFSLYVARLPSDSIQNGPGDGLALVDGDQVIQILSYEGNLKAIDGPATGRDSTDIGVSEAANTPVGSSLGLIGSGNKYGDFKWSIFNLGASPGSLNPGQTLLSAPALKAGTCYPSARSLCQWSTNMNLKCDGYLEDKVGAE